jgi:DeoR/GlpR family transcriptional regulator of sugar metabolism
LDASTSAYHLAQQLMNHRGLRVVTNGIEVAQLLAQNSTHLIMLVGGILRSGTQSVTGPWSLRFLEEVYTRFAFISCSGFTPENGMSEVDIYEAEFRVKAIAAATQVIGLVDSSKFGKTDLTPSVRLERLNHIYTDRGLSSDWIARLDRSGVSYTLCE